MRCYIRELTFLQPQSITRLISRSYLNKPQLNNLVRRLWRVITVPGPRGQLAIYGSNGFHNHGLISGLRVLLARPVRDHVLAADIVGNGSRDAIYLIQGVRE